MYYVISLTVSIIDASTELLRFTKVNELPRLWVTQLRMRTITHVIDTRPFFRPSLQ